MPKSSRLYQFSLGTLLVFVTICCFAAWWWQHPYKVEVSNMATHGSLRIVETRKRKGFSDSVAHGPRTVYDAKGAKVFEDFWQNGVLHGVYRSWNRNKDEIAIELEFDQAKLVHINGKPIEEFTLNGSFDGPAGQRIKRRLTSRSAIVYHNERLCDVIDDISFREDFAIVLNDNTKSDELIAADINLCDIPLFAALLALLEPLELTYTCRYGVLWVTTPDSRLLEEDYCTGIETVGQDPDSRLGKILSRKGIAIEAMNEPMRKVLTDISKQHDLTIIWDEGVWLDSGVSFSLRCDSLRSALGSLFHQYNLTCKAEGDALVVGLR